MYNIHGPHFVLKLTWKLALFIMLILEVSADMVCGQL